MANVNLVDVVAERIKTSPIGELIKEEDLYDIVKQGIERAFFKEREKQTSSWNRETLPPLIIEVIREVLRDSLKPHVARWMAENADTFGEAMKKVVDNGIVGAAEKIMAERSREAAKPMFESMMAALNAERQQQGLPPLPVYF